MPRVYLTDADREQAAVEKVRSSIADGLAAKKLRRNLTNAQIGAEFGLGEKRVPLLMGTAPIRMDMDQLIRLLRFTGHKIVKVQEELQ